jgi:hypothetical protein
LWKRKEKTAKAKWKKILDGGRIEGRGEEEGGWKRTKEIRVMLLFLCVSSFLSFSYSHFASDIFFVYFPSYTYSYFFHFAIS